MSKIIDIDKRRSNREIMDIEVRLERQTRERQAKHLKTMTPPKNRPGVADDFVHYANRPWRPGDEPGDLGFPEGNEYD